MLLEEDLKQSNKIFTNEKCEYFPCHKIKDSVQFNCLFCYCPLYFVPCPGTYTRLDDGKKDCSKCVVPHVGERSWEIMNEYLKR